MIENDLPPKAETPPGIPANPSSGRDLILPAQTSRVTFHVGLPAGACLEVQIEAHTEDGRSLGRQSFVFSDTAAPVPTPAANYDAALPALSGILSRPLADRVRSISTALPAWLFGLALGLYIFTRLIALPEFPIYFFTDEAIQTIQAADLLRDRMHSHAGELLPTFFENGSQFNLSTSVYLQVLPFIFFGKSIWVTRGAAALMTLIAAVVVGLILKRVFQSPYPWLATLILTVTPAWFLHSRTAFETGLATTFYAAFLYFYLLYRSENPRYLYAAIGMAALAFYSYSPVRMVMLVTALLLFFSDLGYHFRQRKTVLLGFYLVLLLAVPYARFLINHPDANEWQMRLLGSYWITDVSLLEKLQKYVLEYLRGLDIFYWYLPHTQDLPRHTMLGYGHLLRQTLPFGLFGIGLALSRIRSSPYRTLLIAFLAAPSGAALVQLGITRVMVMVIPMAILTALAVSEIMEWLKRRKKVPRTLMALTVFSLLSAVSLYMTWDALVNGPYWFSNYSLTGQQYGARQVFGEIKTVLRESPEEHIILSPSWANGTDVVARFFFPDPLPFELGSATGYYNEVRPLDEKTLFVMIPEEYAEIPREKFSEVNVERTLLYPDGRPGFYFVRLKYVDGIETVLTEEKQMRHQLETKTFPLDGEKVILNYTRLDMGETKNLFDGDPHTMVRSWALNPMILDLTFDTPRQMNSISLLVGGSATTLTVQVWRGDSPEPVSFNSQYAEAPRPREAGISFGSTMAVRRMRVDLLNTNDPPEGHVHLWEVTFKNK